MAQDLLEGLASSAAAAPAAQGRALIDLLNDASSDELDATIEVVEGVLSAVLDAADQLGRDVFAEGHRLHPPPVRRHRELLQLSAELHSALAPAYRARKASAR